MHYFLNMSKENTLLKNIGQECFYKSNNDAVPNVGFDTRDTKKNILLKKPFIKETCTDDRFYFSIVELLNKEIPTKYLFLFNEQPNDKILFFVKANLLSNT